MTRISDIAYRYGLFRDLGIKTTDINGVIHPTVSLEMQGRGTNKKKSVSNRKKIYNHYAKLSQNPCTFDEFWGVNKKFYEVIF